MKNSLRKLMLWTGSAILILSTTVIALGMSLAQHAKYSPIDFHGGYPVITRGFFIALWSFWPSLVLFIVGVIVVRRSRVSKL